MKIERVGIRLTLGTIQSVGIEARKFLSAAKIAVEMAGNKSLSEYVTSIICRDKHFKEALKSLE